ncbi:MAG: hypothetical protein ACKOUT_10285 [Novosphingobium sp.]
MINRFNATRAELYAAALFIAALNALALRMQTALDDRGWGNALADLFGVSAIVWFALYALISLGLKAEAIQVPARKDWFICGTLIASCLLPSSAPALAGFLIVATWLLITSRMGEERSLAIVALALTGPLLWGPLILRLMGTELLIFDANIAALLSGNTALGNLVVVPGDKPDLLIMPGCSAFKNLAPVFVLAATLSQLLGTALDRKLAVACVLGVVAVVLINSVRLAMIAWYPAHYEYLHVGGGATLFSYATMLVVVAIIGSALLLQKQRREV